MCGDGSSFWMRRKVSVMLRFNDPQHIASALFYPRSILTIIITIAFCLVYLLVYFLSSSGWASFGVAVGFSVFSYAKWAYMLYRVITQFRYKPPKLLYTPFITFVLLYIMTIAQAATLYSSVSLLVKDAYVGIAAAEPKWKILYLSLFLATETMSALSTGSIFANPFARVPVGFIPLYLQSIQTLLMFTWIAWGLTMMVFRSGMAQKIQHENIANVNERVHRIFTGEESEGHKRL